MLNFIKLDLSEEKYIKALRHFKTSSSSADDYLPEKVIDDNLDDDVSNLQ